MGKRGSLPQQPLTHSSARADHCALSRKGRGHARRRRCILAKRTQCVCHLGRPRQRKWGPMITGRCSWVPALATLGRDDILIGQPTAAENDDRQRASVSRLFFTGNRATPTCRAGTAAIFAKRTQPRFGRTNPIAFWPNEPNRILTKAEPGAILDSLTPHP
jgi:hypothetical protein